MIKSNKEDTGLPCFDFDCCFANSKKRAKAPFTEFPGEKVKRLIDFPRTLPLSSICQLYDQHVGLVGTGIAIHPYYLITAAHNVYDIKKKSEYMPLIYPGLHRGNRDLIMPVVPEDIQRHHFFDFEDDQYDIALIRTMSPFDNFYPIKSWWQLKDELNLPDIHFAVRTSDNFPLYVLGYKARYRNAGLHWDGGVTVAAVGNVVGYDCSTVKGMSGGPILSDIRHNGVRNEIIGIHAGGFSAATDVIPQRSNKGILFTNKIIEWVNGIISGGLHV